MKTIKILSVILCLELFLSACSVGSEFDPSREIGVTSREEGSGTRDAFEELFGIDRTTDNAIVTNSTAVMLTTVSDDPYAIGYVSMGALNDSVKALKIEGVAPSVKTVKSGEYKVSRSFNIITKGKLSPFASDFVEFILSKEGGRIAEEMGYTSAGGMNAYKAQGFSGKLRVSGSSSVAPLMEKLAESYEKINPKTDIEVQQSDSSSGIADAIDGTSDIGMSSRELEATERSRGAKATVIARDGIAVIVNNNCKAESLSLGDVKAIFESGSVYWSDILKENSR